MPFLDRTSLIFDRLQPVHVLEGHEENVRAVAISETTGDFATCSGSTVRVWTVNGILLATQSTGSSAQPITAVAWSKVRSAHSFSCNHL